MILSQFHITLTKKKKNPKEKLTGEDDEIGVLRLNDPVNEGSGVEIGAGGHLALEHVLALGVSAVGVVHVGDLQDLERPISLPKSQQPR